MRFRLKIPTYSLLFFMILFVFGCSKDEKSSKIGLVMGENSSISYLPSEILVQISCSGQWKLSFDYETTGENWCSATKTSGLGDESITIYVESNTWDRSREVDLLLTSGSDYARSEITQACWDDFEVVQATDKVEIMTARPEWMELPKIEDYANSGVITHDTYIYSEKVRNYTALYDTINKIAHWVAYPMTSKYLGSSGRTENWAYDPKVPMKYQPKLTSSYPAEEYDRGHIVASASRTANSQTNSQTFYFTNITAQQSYLNSYYISSLESDLRSWADGVDTLYVTTGVKLGENTTLDISGSRVAVPDYYFYVVLALDGGAYRSIGFWVENKSLSLSEKPLRDCVRTVSGIEVLTGFEFFGALEDVSVKDVVDFDYWGI